MAANRSSTPNVQPVTGGVGALPPTPAPPVTYPVRCSVKLQEDGSAVVTFKMDADVTRRHQNRAYKLDLGEYLWANVLRAAIEASVY